MKITKRRLKTLIENYLYETIGADKPNPNPDGAGAAGSGDGDSGENNKPDESLKKAFRVSAYYSDDGKNFDVAIKFKHNMSKKRKTHSIESVKAQLDTYSQTTNQNAITIATNLLAPPREIRKLAGEKGQKDINKNIGNDVLLALGIKIRKNFEKGPEKEGSDGDSIVKQIEVAIGMKDADDKWTKEGTDKAWRTWVDGKKAAIEKDYPGDIELLKKSWSKFSKKNKSKGVKSSGSGMLSFIKKYGVAK